MTFLQRFLGPRGDGKIGKLRELPALEALTEAELAEVAAAGELALITAGSVLLQEGQRARWCYLVLAGSLRPSDDPGHAPTVVATTDLVVLAMSATDFQALLQACPGFARAVDGSLTHQTTAVVAPSRSPRPVLQLVGGA
jgi:CRP-like cAMP-binding protein